MHLRSLTLFQFKNIAEAKFDYCEKINCLVGNNGLGKTNVLDAIHYLSFGKSYFTNLDVQNIQFGQESFMTQGHYQLDDVEEKITCSFQKGSKKKLKRNDKDYKKLSEHIGFIPLVMVSPSDIKLIIDGSEERRKFMDSVISQFDRGYLEHLIQYNKALTNRNQLLKKFFKEQVYDQNLIDALNIQLLKHGKAVYNARAQFIEQITPVFQKYYTMVSGGHEAVDLKYTSNLQEDSFENILENQIQKDRYLQYTSKGVHKDDLKMQLSSHPIKTTGSQGQQKTYMVALKLAQYEFIKDTTEKRPLLLLDDIFDKFDQDRVTQIINIVNDEQFGQIFISDANKKRLPGILKALKNEYKVFEFPLSDNRKNEKNEND